MAFQMPFESKTGDNYPDAYYKISTVVLDLDSSLVNCVVKVFKSRAASKNGKAPLSEHPVHSEVFRAKAKAEDPDGAFEAVLKGEARSVLYPELKKLNRFKDAVDV